MNILLIYPAYPDTFWSFRYALRFISKKAASPPLGLITVSAMLPKTWKKKLVDLNITKLQSSDMEWADYVMISAMYIQKESVGEVLDSCASQQVKIIAGGPLFTQEYQNYPQVDHFILNEAEITMPHFLKDLASGVVPKRIYQTDQYADITASPVPDFHLLDMKAYAFMSMQVSRGCPYSCDFCEITALLGHKVRMKSNEQILNELEALYLLKWRGPVSIVDDNFIGKTKQVKHKLVPAIHQWMKAHKGPFTFNTQTSINLADDEELLELMINTGFTSTFIGIETPDEVSLNYCNKVQNERRDLLHSVTKIQQAGMQVSAGFIVGFDSDQPSVFQRQIDFIKRSGIVSAMVGLLNAPRNTKLYERMEKERRLTVDATGSNTDFTMNFVPKMDKAQLLKGYEEILHQIYTVKPYYSRIKQFFLNYNKAPGKLNKIKWAYIKGFIKSIFVIGIINKGRSHYWKLLIWTLFNRPGLFIDAITLSIYGYHFRKIYGITKA